MEKQMGILLFLRVFCSVIDLPPKYIHMYIFSTSEIIPPRSSSSSSVGSSDALGKQREKKEQTFTLLEVESIFLFL